MGRLVQVVIAGGMLSLVGCVSVEQQLKETAHDISIERHLLTGTRILRSPDLTLQNVKAISSTSQSAYLQLTRTADSDSYCLYTTSSIIGIGWSLFDAAQDADDQQLNVIKTKSDVRRDGIREEDCIELSRTYLEQHQQNGLDIKLMASNRDIHFGVLPADVQLFLTSVDRVTKDPK